MDVAGGHLVEDGKGALLRLGIRHADPEDEAAPVQLLLDLRRVAARDRSRQETTEVGSGRRLYRVFAHRCLLNIRLLRRPRVSGAHFSLAEEIIAHFSLAEEIIADSGTRL